MSFERASTHEIDPHHQRRPRHRWLRRVALLVGLLLAAAAVLRIWWDWEAQRLLRSALEQYRAASQPVFIEDFGFIEIADADNMAVPLSRAAATLLEPSDAPVSLQNLASGRGLVDQHADYVALLVASNNEVFQRMRGAWDRPGVQWDLQIVRPYINITLPHLSPQKNLAQLCYVAAVHHHRRGDDQAAIAALDDMLNIATALSYSWPCLMQHMVAIAISDMCADALEQVTPGLHVENAPPDDAPAERACSRADVEALIERLMSTKRMQAGWHWAMSGERMTLYDAGELVTENAASEFWLFKPAFRMNTIRMMELCTKAQDAGLASDWPTADARLTDVEDTDDGNLVTHFVSNLLLPSYARAVGLHHWALMRRQLAATALAIRLYELDHGRRPETLQQLVPGYLRYVPEDRFATDHSAIRYKPNASPPVLYSVGVNGLDDMGLAPCDDLPRDYTQPVDMVFFLDGNRPLLEPPPEESTQAENEHVNHDGGDG